MIEVRQAVDEDAQGMCAVLNPLIEAGGTTAHRVLYEADRMREDYVRHPLRVSCVVAVLDGVVVGYQSVKRSDPNWPGLDVFPPDWGVIASFVSSAAHGQGIGRKMFDVTAAAAREAGLVAIDATIRRENAIGLGYYSRIGFVDHASDAERISKRFDL